MPDVISADPPDTVLDGYLSEDSDGDQRFILSLARGTHPRHKSYRLPRTYDELDDFLADVHWPALHWPTEDLSAWGVFSAKPAAEAHAHPLDRAVECLVRHWMACPECIAQQHCALGNRLDAVVEYAKQRYPEVALERAKGGDAFCGLASTASLQA